MPKEINEVTVVGGGSAGWMSAATLVRFFPNKKINVIESPDHPIIGVGESTLGHINRWLFALCIKDEDFMKASDASYKHSIAFTDFHRKGSGRIQYPFGIPFMDSCEYGFNDWHIMKFFYPWIPESDFAYSYNPSTTFAEMSVMVDHNDGTFDNYNPREDVAYHIDATKFGQWLKNVYCVPQGVNLIPATVKDVRTNEDGVECLILDDGSEHKADLYIDCTGFKSLLLGQALKGEFISYQDWIPNNKAWAARMPYTDQEKEQVGYTNCTALSNGWVWNTPCHSRIGTGYVYSDKYITPEEALKEFQDHLGRDDLEFRSIDFKCGTYSKVWDKNVVGIGLSAGFIEPLESNGLYTIHEYLMVLMKSLSKKYINQWDRDAFNLTVRPMYDVFATFVSSHYKLSCRDDSQYWRDITERTSISGEHNGVPETQGDFNNLWKAKMVNDVYDPGSGLPYIASGLGYSTVDDATLATWAYYYHKEPHIYKELADNIYERFTQRKQKWAEAAKTYPSIHKYIQNKYYSN